MSKDQEADIRELEMFVRKLKKRERRITKLRQTMEQTLELLKKEVEQ